MASYYDNCDLEIRLLYITCIQILKFSFNQTEWLIDQSISSCQCVMYLNFFCTRYIQPSLPFFRGTSLQISSLTASPLLHFTLNHVLSVSVSKDLICVSLHRSTLIHDATGMRYLVYINCWWQCLLNDTELRYHKPLESYIGLRYKLQLWTILRRYRDWSMCKVFINYDVRIIGKVSYHTTITIG